MDKEIRNKLRNTVTKCRQLLEEAIGELLEGQFGIHADGTVEDATAMTHLSAEDQEYREQSIVHLEHIERSPPRTRGDGEEVVVDPVRHRAGTTMVPG